jgi:hypothetical protein
VAPDTARVPTGNSESGPGAAPLGAAMKTSTGFVLACAVLGTAIAPAAGALAASTAYRFTDLDLRDPHVYVSFINCWDFTDNTLTGYSLNSDLQTRIRADSSGDGLLDLSLLVVFDPLDQAGAGGLLRFGESSCTAPLAGTTCGPAPYEDLQSAGSANSTLDPCLGVLPGTTYASYVPGVSAPAAPCFVSDELPTFTLPLFADTPVSLHHVRVAATYSGAPATALVTGLLRGFLPEADANNIILPASQPIVGGQPLSVLLPGGDPAGPAVCCSSHNDLDLGPSSERGWWMYFNFTAVQVPYSGPSVGVGPASAFRLLPASSNPGRSPVRLAYQLGTPGPVSVTVHDLAGRRIAAPVSGWRPAGAGEFTWDGRTETGAAAAPGLYVVRLASTEGTLVRKIALVR